MPNVDDAITHHVIVDAGVPAAFDAFTARLGEWWPLSYTFSGSHVTDAAIEPRVGGVWSERNDLILAELKRRLRARGKPASVRPPFLAQVRAGPEITWPGAGRHRSCRFRVGPFD